MLNGGYPTETEIDEFLAERGFEMTDLGTANWYIEGKKRLWAMLNSLDWAIALGVYCPTPTTFNVRGGKYLFKNTVKTFSAGEAIDPTDNDTTYVWMTADNTAGYGIDGDGWPTAEHIKLAEIDVDSDGVITAVRDLRGETFLQKIGNLTGSHIANVGTAGGLPFVLTATLVAGNTVQIHNANAPFKYRVIRAWSIATSEDGGTWQVKNGNNDITQAVAVTEIDKAIDEAGTIDDDYHEIAQNGSLSVAGDGENADCIVYIECIRVA